MKEIWEKHWQKILIVIVLLIAGCCFLFTERENPYLDNLMRDDRLALKKNIVVLGVDKRA